MRTIYDCMVIDMAKAVHYHLSYINSVSRTDVVAESCFRFPAIEYIERHPKFGYSVILEHSHPVYKFRRIDLAWAKKGADSPSAFMEMKYVKKETAEKSEQQRYYNDLERLATILSTDNNAKCYFLASGLSLNWEDCFMNTYKPDETNTDTEVTKAGKKKKNDRKIKSVYNDWFSFSAEKPGKVIKIKDDIWHRAFIGDYKRRNDVPEPSLRRFTTRLLWISGDAHSFEDTSITAIWKIGR